MGKKIYLLRHAKSDHPTGVDDQDRPLNERGKGDALKMGQYIAKTLAMPDKVLCSTAKRTRQTVQYVSQSFAKEPLTDFLKTLYLATPGEIIKEISKLDEGVTSVMVVAHNPGIHQLGVLLTGYASNEKQYGAMRIKFPTCGLAVFSTTIASWKEIEPGICMLEQFVSPHDILIMSQTKD